MATVAETAPHTASSTTERAYPRTASGKTLFLVTLGVVVLGVALAVVAGVLGIVWLGFVVPIAYFVYLIALLFFAGRAISYRNRPGEAATSILLAVLLSPAVALTPAIGIAGNALAESNLGSLMGGGLTGNGTDSFGSDLGGQPMEDLGEPMGDEPMEDLGEPMDDSGGDQWFQSDLPPEARDDVTEAEYLDFVECMNDATQDYGTCMAIVT